MHDVVLSRPDRLGDVIITSSLIPLLHAAWPESRLHWMASTAYLPLFRGHPLLAGCISLQEAAGHLAALRPQALIHFHPCSTLVETASRAGVCRQIGYRNRWWTQGLTEAVSDDRRWGLKHEAAYAHQLAGHYLPLPDPPDEWKPSLHLPEDARESLRSKLPLELNLIEHFALNPTAYSSVLRWPSERFLEVSQWVYRHHRLAPLLIGHDPKDPSIAWLEGRLRESGIPKVNLAGRLDVGELGWLLRGVRLHLARNTGTSHLAAAVGCPQVELFIRFQGRYSATRWRALSASSFSVVPELERRPVEPNPRYWKRCAESLTVDKVRRQIDCALGVTR